LPRHLHVRFFALFCAATALWPASFAHEARLSFPDNPRFTVLRLEEQLGLGAVTVTAMGQDAQGFLWIGTQTGLYRFDGARAQKMTEVEDMIGHYVLDLLIAPDGSPWFAGSHGIAHYTSGKFVPLPIPHEAIPIASGNQIFAVDRQGVVFVFLFKHGLLRVDSLHPARLKVFGEADGIQEPLAGIVRAPDDSFWFTFGAHLAHISAGSSSVEIDPGITLPKERIVALLFDSQQTLWLRTSSRLARLDPQLHKIKFEPVSVGVASEEEGKPSLDRHGRLLVPSSAGLFWHSDEQGGWCVLTDKQGIASNDVQSALEDREGALWVAGSGTGLERLPGIHEWASWTTVEGLPDNTIWSTLRDLQGRLWVGTGRGIGVWDAPSHRWLKIPSLEAHGRKEIRQLQLAGDGSVWALTVAGSLARVDPQNFAVTWIPYYRGRTFATVYAAPDGSIWASTHSRLARFDPHKPVSDPEDVPLPPGTANEIVYLSFAPSGVLWASGPGALFRYDGQRWRVFTQADGLSGQTITSVVAINDNELWIGYNDVVLVSHVRLDSRGTLNFENLAWDRTISLHDSKHRTWFDGTDGIALLHPDGRVRRISRADGLIWDDISPWTGVHEEPDGSFLIATSRGLSRFQPAPRSEEPARSNAVLTSISLGGLERSPAENPQVNSADGTLAVQFSPMVLDAPQRVSCLYQLKGLEKYPTETQLREIHYGGLPPGNYEFLVKCQSPDSTIFSSPAAFRFQVLPGFWQTWWARLLGAAVFLLVFSSFVSIRTRTLNRRRVELEKAVAQRNAELLLKNQELAEICLTDPLTSARNRRYFYETISTDIAQAVRSHLKSIDPRSSPAPRRELIFLLVDIDRFKRVNDELGHTAGDRLLREVAKRIASIMRRSDDLVRWGGEEFLLVCRTTDRENASHLCARVMEAIRDLPFDVGNGVEIHKTCSIGWAPYPWLRDGVGLLSVDNVIELADKALYLAKREGRNRSYGLLPAPEIEKSERSVSIENLRDCPPDLVHIV